MPKTYYCTSSNKNVTIEDCVRCRLMCVHNPSCHEAMLMSGPMITRWGYAEINRFLESRRGAV